MRAQVSLLAKAHDIDTEGLDQAFKHTAGDILRANSQ
jgi:hypothetical protein